MIAFGNSKINIGLNVLDKRPDGFHNITSVFFPTGLGDVCEGVKNASGKFNLQTSGIPIPKGPNVMEKVYQLVNHDFNLGGLDVWLHKVVPIGAGLGGGSSDAACMLKIINEEFDLQLDTEYKLNLLLKVGSDCPYFEDAQPRFVSGRGEIFKPIPLHLEGKHLVMVHPGIHISTAEAYANLTPQNDENNLEEILLNTAISQWKHHIKNDFETFAFRRHPEIEEIKNSLYSQGAEYASMSGSGSTVYGIFDGKPELNFPAYAYSILKVPNY